MFVVIKSVFDLTGNTYLHVSLLYLKNFAPTEITKSLCEKIPFRIAPSSHTKQFSIIVKLMKSLPLYFRRNKNVFNTRSVTKTHTFMKLKNYWFIHNISNIIDATRVCFVCRVTIKYCVQ